MGRWCWVIVGLLVGCGGSQDRSARSGTFQSEAREQPARVVGEQPGTTGIGASVVGSPRDTSMGASSASGADQDVCSAMMQNAALRLRDLPDGVELTITPKDPDDVAGIAKAARGIESSGAPRGAASACALQDLGEHDATMRVTEDGESVHLYITTSTPEHVAMVRQHIRDFARSTGASASGTAGGEPGDTGGGQR